MSIIVESNGVELDKGTKYVYLHSVPNTIVGHWDVPASVTHLTGHGISNPLRGHTGITSIFIPESVCFIAPSDLKECPNLEKVSVSPDNPFYSSDTNGALLNKDQTVLLMVPPKLRGIYTMPGTVRQIERDAFRSCKGVTTILFSDNLKRIKDGAFAYCEQLMHLSFPKMLGFISPDAFLGCKRIARFDVDADNPYLSADTAGVLYNKDHTTLLHAPAKLAGRYVVPESVTCIGEAAFYECRYLTELALPTGLTTVGDRAFSHCAHLKQATLPTGVTHMGDLVYLACDSIEEIFIPNCMTDAANIGITHNKSLNTIRVTPDHPCLSNDNYGVLLNKDQTKIIYAPANLADRYFLPETVREIQQDAFVRCQELTSVVVPVDAVKSIDWDVFNQCGKLKQKLARDMECMVVYDYDARSVYRVHKDIEAGCILDLAKEIPDRTFENHSRMTRLFLPPTIKRIGQAAFKGCTNLSQITVVGESPYLYTDDCGVLYLNINDNVALVRAPINLAGHYCVPDGVTHVCANAFEGCEHLTGVTMPASVWSVAAATFDNCPNLTEVTIHSKDSLYFNPFVRCPLVTLRGIAGGRTESFARTNGIPFTAI